MAHYAKVDQGKVIDVIVAEPEFFDTFVDTNPGEWVETFKDASQRKHFAGKGMIYDVNLDAFYHEQPYSSWTFDEETCNWVPPVAKPDGAYDWNEETQTWDSIYTTE